MRKRETRVEHTCIVCLDREYLSRQGVTGLWNSSSRASKQGLVGAVLPIPYGIVTNLVSRVQRRANTHN